MKTLIFTLLLSASAFCGDWALWTGFTGGGAAGGGARYSLSDNVCIDVGAGGGIADANNGAVWADVFFIGQTVGITFASSFADGATPTFNLGVAYALEKAVTKDIVIGIAPTLIDYSLNSGDIGLVSGWASYLVLNL